MPSLPRMPSKLRFTFRAFVASASSEKCRDLRAFDIHYVVPSLSEHTMKSIVSLKVPRVINEICTIETPTTIASIIIFEAHNRSVFAGYYAT